jgi:hypothetical protein
MRTSSRSGISCARSRSTSRSRSDSASSMPSAGSTCRFEAAQLRDDVVQRVEEKVRIELLAQRVEPGLGDLARAVARPSRSAAVAPRQS